MPFSHHVEVACPPLGPEFPSTFQRVLAVNHRRDSVTFATVDAQNSSRPGWLELDGRHVNGNALSGRAAARLVAVCAVLAGLFAMHGLSGQGCPGGLGAPTTSMRHPVRMATATDGPALAAAAMATSVSRPLMHSKVTIGMDGQLGEVCLATTPSSGWAARLLALLVGVSVIGVTTALRSPTVISHPDNCQRRAPPLAGSTLLRELCVSRT